MTATKEVEVLASPWGHEITRYEINEQPWIKHADACRLMGIARPANAIVRISDQGKLKVNMNTARLTGGIRRGNPIVWLLNRKGFLELAFRSDKPEANKLRSWAADVVLAVEDKGYYVKPGAVLPGAGNLDQLGVALAQALVAGLMPVVQAMTDRVAGIEAEVAKLKGQLASKPAKALPVAPRLREATQHSTGSRHWEPVTTSDLFTAAVVRKQLRLPAFDDQGREFSFGLKGRDGKPWAAYTGPGGTDARWIPRGEVIGAIKALRSQVVDA